MFIKKEHFPFTEEILRPSVIHVLFLLFLDSVLRLVSGNAISAAVVLRSNKSWRSAEFVEKFIVSSFSFTELGVVDK